MDLDIKKKVVLVTGGAKGIGKAISICLASEHAIPVIVDKDKLAAMQLIEQLEQAHYVIGDLSELETCQRAVFETFEKYGRIDGVCNNAGINDNIGLENGNPSAFRQSLKLNLFHYYDLAHFALPFLKQTKGAIVNISSKTAITGQGSTSAYAAAKGGILALTREWAVELLKYGIRVNAVVPSEVMTPLYRNWLSTFPDPKLKKQQIEANIPLENRMTKMEEIADMVVFLLSKRASHITGQHLFVDGGYVHLDRSLSILNLKKETDF